MYTSCRNHLLGRAYHESSNVAPDLMTLVTSGGPS